ncbi:hypothetical protein [Gluconobacter cerinus]|uniref:hypothetical protein n=1 Tax=Gluconobacter cerinus TaxID=38307 RepID=UPI001B8CE1B7|nr:hypothetical protein [Gluconobacter cerinus]MBS0984254.1 hypothetical protein [Gluconobacter cerinus]
MDTLVPVAMGSASALLLTGGFFVGCVGIVTAQQSRALQGGGLMILGIMSCVMTYLSMPAVVDPWTAFSKAHHCQIVEKRQGHGNAGLGMATTGQVGVVLGEDTPNQTAYKCDDGITYWRNDQ